eukprot:1600041-Pyramimonas_sp.AAC.1
MYTTDMHANEAEMRFWAISHYVRCIMKLGVFPFPRSRWTKARESIRAMGLLMNTHGLWQEAFRTCAEGRVQPEPVPSGALAILDRDLCDGGGGELGASE